MARTNLTQAITKTLETLESGETFTQNKLAEKTDLNFRTTQKILVLLDSIQDILNNKVIEIANLDNNIKIIQMKERSSLSSYPENVQKLIIKTGHYPTYSREEEILTHLYLRNAIEKNLAIELPEDVSLKKLIQMGHVHRTDELRYYLSTDARIIAKGALMLYPELKDMVGPFQSEYKKVLRKLMQNKQTGRKLRDGKI